MRILMNLLGLLRTAKATTVVVPDLNGERMAKAMGFAHVTEIAPGHFFAFGIQRQGVMRRGAALSHSQGPNQ
jgi:hypothetical protein